MKCEDCKYFEWCEEDEEERDKCEKEVRNWLDSKKEGKAPEDCADAFFLTMMGLCHRYPPKLYCDEDYRNPTVRYDDWCGEFQPRKINNLKKGDKE